MNEDEEKLKNKLKFFKENFKFSSEEGRLAKDIIYTILNEMLVRDYQERTDFPTL